MDIMSTRRIFTRHHCELAGGGHTETNDAFVEERASSFGVAAEVKLGG